MKVMKVMKVLLFLVLPLCCSLIEPNKGCKGLQSCRNRIKLLKQRLHFVNKLKENCRHPHPQLKCPQLEFESECIHPTNESQPRPEKLLDSFNELFEKGKNIIAGYPFQVVSKKWQYFINIMHIILDNYKIYFSIGIFNN